jgi:hypothetical protein
LEKESEDYQNYSSLLEIKEEEDLENFSKLDEFINIEMDLEKELEELIKEEEDLDLEISNLKKEELLIEKSEEEINENRNRFIIENNNYEQKL